MISYLESAEGKAALREIDAAKANLMLNRNDLTNGFADDIPDAFIDHFKSMDESTFKEIFPQ